MADLKIIKCQNSDEVITQANQLLKKLINYQTLLLLSGGFTSKPLYQKIALERTLNPGAVALVDERYGGQFHSDSNELMIKSTGLVDYLIFQNIPFDKILEDQSLDKTAQDYEAKIQDLFKKFSQKVAIMGIGEDGHTAGILPETIYDHTKWVIGYQTDKSQFSSRITLTFEALSQINIFLILVTGQNKGSGLKKALGSFDRFQVPASCYKLFSSDNYLITELDLT